MSLPKYAQIIASGAGPDFESLVEAYKIALGANDTDDIDFGDADFAGPGGSGKGPEDGKEAIEEQATALAATLVMYIHSLREEGALTGDLDDEGDFEVDIDTGDS